MLGNNTLQILINRIYIYIYIKLASKYCWLLLFAFISNSSNQRISYYTGSVFDGSGWALSLMVSSQLVLGAGGLQSASTVLLKL